MKDRLVHVLNSLTAKYVAVFVLLVTVPAIGISWYLLDSSYNDNKRALIHQQQEEAKALAGRIDQTLFEIADRLGSIHGQGLGRDTLEATLQPLLLSEHTPGEAFYMDGKGATVASVGPRNLDGGLAAAGFAKAKQGDFVGPVRIFTEFGETKNAFKVAAPENYGPGVVGTELSGNAFSTYFSASSVGDRYAYAVSRDGLVLSYPSELLQSVTGNLGFGDFTDLPRRLRLRQVEQALSGHDAVGSATGENLRHRKVLSAWATVPLSGWKVFVEQPETAAFAALSSKIWKTALLIALFVLVAIALSILLARRLVRPIKRLQVAAEAIGAGAYDERIELDRRDELGALASAFNQMAERVQELITGLERRVAERTKALEVASQHKSDFLANMSHELGRRSTPSSASPRS